MKGSTLLIFTLLLTNFAYGSFSKTCDLAPGTISEDGTAYLVLDQVNREMVLRGVTTNEIELNFIDTVFISDVDQETLKMLGVEALNSGEKLSAYLTEGFNDNDDMVVIYSFIDEIKRDGIHKSEYDYILFKNSTDGSIKISKCQ